jgi:DNA mismatch repair protein MutL
MGSIRILPKHLVNMIAAGEVIERPASVVKELIENALDAGATRIEVSVEDGGRKLIQVRDDGGGMDGEDLALAFAPHATSKIRGDEDLFRIDTLGFRGEALPSVASVCHAHIRTRRRAKGGGEEAAGHEVSASGGAIEPVRPCPAPPGTTVTVRDLFYNTPARRKFLRTANTEMGHIGEQVVRLALPHPDVAFRLTHNRREVYNLPPAASTAARVEGLFGPELRQSLLPVASRTGPVGVNGLLGRPSAARASSRWQYFFLNGRYIRDRLLSHALREAHRGLIDPSRWPVAFLFIEVDPSDVDVNVHPTKIEVRFRDSQRVHAELLAALKQTLNKADLMPTASLDAAQGAMTEAAQPEHDAADTDDRRASLRQALADFFKSAPRPQPRLSFPEHTSGPRPVSAPPVGRADRPVPPPAEPPARYVPADAAPQQGRSEGIAAEPPKTAPVDRAAPAPPSPARAIQIHNAYVVTACEDGLLIVDQHALHERILYNELRRRLAEGRLTGQKRLIPETLRVTPAEADTLQRHATLLARLGIELGSFGPDTVAVQQFPVLLANRRVAPGRFMRELIDVLTESQQAEPEQLLESLLAMMACRAAVKAGDPLTPEEMHDLLARRQEAEKASACPHGRPTTLRVTLKDLERQFRRT